MTKEEKQEFDNIRAVQNLIMEKLKVVDNTLTDFNGKVSLLDSAIQETNQWMVPLNKAIISLVNTENAIKTRQQEDFLAVGITLGEWKRDWKSTNDLLFKHVDVINKIEERMGTLLDVIGKVCSKVEDISVSVVDLQANIKNGINNKNSNQDVGVSNTCLVGEGD